MRTLLTNESVDNVVINSMLSIIEWHSARIFLTILQTLLSTGWRSVESCENLPNHPTIVPMQPYPMGYISATCLARAFAWRSIVIALTAARRVAYQRSASADKEASCRGWDRRESCGAKIVGGSTSRLPRMLGRTPRRVRTLHSFDSRESTYNTYRMIPSAQRLRLLSRRCRRRRRRRRQLCIDHYPLKQISNLH